MSTNEKYVNVALNAFGQTTAYLCDIKEIKTGDFVIVPGLSGENTGRVMSIVPKKVFSISLARTNKVIRKASPEEINEVADLFGIAKNPEFADEEDDDCFLTNNGYGTRELNKLMKKYQQKQAQKEQAAVAKEVSQAEEKPLKKERYIQGPIKEDEGLPIYWRYVAIVILALYFLKDYIFE